MSRGVDVLAVMDEAAQRMECPTASGPKEWMVCHERLREARAAVAELVEAAREMVIANHGMPANPADESDPVCRAALETMLSALAKFGPHP